MDRQKRLSSAFPFSFLDVASVVCELRHNFSLYDAFYVAITLTHQAPLATLDRRMDSSAAAYCTVLVGPE